MWRAYHERQEKKAFRTMIVQQLIDLPSSERAQKVKEMTKMSFHIPYSQKTTLSRSVIYQWLKDYKQAKDPSQVLMDKERSDRGTFRKLTNKQKNALVAWRSACRDRTTEELREELMVHKETKDGPIPSASTIARYLRSVNLDRRSMKILENPGAGKTRLPFQADYPQELWQIDTKGEKISLIDETTGELIDGKPVIIIDDYSRYILAFYYVVNEDEAAILQILKYTILHYGVPERLYTDLGGPYMGHSLKQALLLVGCKKMATPKQDPQSKGKIERVMPWFTAHLENELLALSRQFTVSEATEYGQALVGQDYNRRIHSETQETPEDRYFRFPAEYRRFVSPKAMGQIFMKGKKAKVSNTGMIRFNNNKYLVPDSTLYRQQVYIRYDEMDDGKVSVWHKDRYYGEAPLYTPNNDYTQRLNHLKQITKTPTPPEIKPAPKYTYLERKLATHRQQVEDQDLNTELANLHSKKENVRAMLTETLDEQPEADSAPFTPDKMIHLLSVLLKQQLGAYDRLCVHTVWDSCGPFTEEMVRQTAGAFLAQNKSTAVEDYLDQLQIEALTEKG